MSCRIVLAKPEDLETGPNHLNFRFLTMTMVRNSLSNGCFDLSVNLFVGNMVRVRNEEELNKHPCFHSDPVVCFMFVSGSPCNHV